MVLERQIIQQRRQQQREVPTAPQQRIKGPRVKILRDIENDLVRESNWRHGLRSRLVMTLVISRFIPICQVSWRTEFLDGAHLTLMQLGCGGLARSIVAFDAGKYVEGRGAGVVAKLDLGGGPFTATLRLLLG